MSEPKSPIINCHTHVFTGDHVPPWLAKTFLPWPFYRLLPLSGVVKLLRWWYNNPGRVPYTNQYKKFERWLYRVRMVLARSFVLSLLKNLLGIFLTINVFFFAYDWLSSLIKPASSAVETGILSQVRQWLESFEVVITVSSAFVKILFFLLLMIFFKSGRNLIFFVLKRFWKFLGLLPGKQTMALLKRYLLIGRFSRYEGQAKIFEKLQRQYPPGSGFVVLPMDMEYMDAGAPAHELQSQMDELAAIKRKNPKTFFPFVFADPRRIKADRRYFDYTVGENGEIIPADDCLIKKWLEDQHFSGIKIYPALGYYPFDEALLALWKYAADKGFPILTHCIRGTIFYRGRKKKEWDEHPVFKQSTKADTDRDGDEQDNEEPDDEQFDQLLLPERKNIDFQVIFTHPLNYLCLLDETLLRKLVGRSTDERIKKAFGYTDARTPMKHNLHHLKLCFGHFGGDDEWERFMERDRDNYSSQLFKAPSRGVEFLYNDNSPQKKRRPGKPEQIWKFVDWYTIICSLMLQHPNVYADISYILYKPGILPLLKLTLQNPGLREKVLYGSDFYVVRNHKSDKEMLANIMAGLSEEEFDLIARGNPKKFLDPKTYPSTSQSMNT